MRRKALVSPGLACAAFIVAAALSGCVLWPSRTEEPAKNEMPVIPLKILPPKSVESTATAAETPAGSPEGLMNAISRQTAALTARKTGTKPGEAAKLGAESSAPAAESTSADAQELSVQNLLAQLGAKDTRTPGEDEAYKRLLGAGRAAAAPPAEGADEYSFLGDARDALVKNQSDAARAKTKEALKLIRLKADPVIERVAFATDVRNYGDADVVSPAAFAPGQKVLVVTDLSDFACEAVGNGSVAPAQAELYYTKMSQRLVIYDPKGKLYWQNAYGVFEYQASHYIWTMFIPRIFDLPRDLPAGEYVLKVEISDVLAGRQAESSVKFTVK
jgi:hypothetical protein